jgi:hypothetical protein
LSVTSGTNEALRGDDRVYFLLQTLLCINRS